MPRTARSAAEPSSAVPADTVWSTPLDPAGAPVRPRRGDTNTISAFGDCRQLTAPEIAELDPAAAARLPASMQELRERLGALEERVGRLEKGTV